MRFPFDPLVPLIEQRYQPDPKDTVITIVGKTARVLGVQRSLVYRWQQRGLTHETADRLACALDFHPAELWHEWGSEVEIPERQPCGTYGGAKIHARAGTDLCDPCRQAKAVYEKAWRRRNPEREQARLERSYAKRGKYWRKEAA